MKRTSPPLRFLVGAFCTLAVSLMPPSHPAIAADFVTLKGHAGPIMDVAVSPATGEVGSASFDNSVGLWSGTRPNWLEGHEAAVNAVVFIDDQRVASAGDDYDAIIWDREKGTSERLEGHTAKIMGLAVTPDKKWLASASWDARIGLWPLDGDQTAKIEPIYLKGHTAGVNAVAFSSDGKTLYSASVDGTIRVWDVASAEEKRVLVSNGFGINVFSFGGRDTNGAASWVAYGALDGVTRVIDIASGEQIRDFTLDRRPILAMAINDESNRLATGDGQGYITVIDTEKWRIAKDFRASLRGPIWALAFSPDGENILAGGIEDIVYSWPIDRINEFQPMAKTTPSFLRNPEEMSNGERQFARKCSVCHSLSADGRRTAGPTLFNIFGRKAGTLPGYKYSKTLQNSELHWNEKTIDLLFDLGPDHYIPGSKMPMQRIVAPQDRLDLITYLKAATKSGSE